MQATLSGLRVFSSVCRLFEAGIELTHEIQKSKKRPLSIWEKVHIVSLSVFGFTQFLQGAAIVGGGKTLQNVTRLAADTSHIGYIWTKKFSSEGVPTKDAILTSGVSAIDLVGLSSELIPDTQPVLKAIIGYCGDISAAAFSIAQTTPDFKNVATALLGGIHILFKNDLPYIIHEPEFLEWFKKSSHFNKDLLCPLSGQFRLHSVRNKNNPNLIVEKDELERRHREGLPIIIEGLHYSRSDFEETPDSNEDKTAVKNYLNFRLKYVQAALIKDQNRIPACLHQVKDLKKYRCQLTSHPIRHIVCPRTQPNGIYYEHIDLIAHLEHNPEVLPPGWPHDLPFNRENIIEPEELQGEINKNLRAIDRALNVAICQNEEARL